MHDSVQTFRSSRRGFSLVEVLMAVFILGIGVISVAALFPAGIAQQRRSADETIGPIVANSALALLRAKLVESDFGHVFNSQQVVDGDFGWSRPALYLQDDPATDARKGAINIFRELTSASLGTASEIPWNIDQFGGVPPSVVVQPHERYYPLLSTPLGTGTANAPKPQYVWDCMFRRFQGRILVAVFVYRVNVPGGQAVPYTVQPHPLVVDTPPVPTHINLTANPPPIYCANGEWTPNGLVLADVTDDAIVQGTKAGTEYDPAHPGTVQSGAYPQAWQEPGQWILDQNNNIYRVLSRRRANLNSNVQVELVRPVPHLPILNQGGGQAVFFLPDLSRPEVVTDIWYVPTIVRVDVDGDGTIAGGETTVTWTLTPVYAAVKEL